MRRAFIGTIPSLIPGEKIGGEFTLKPNGTAEFIQRRIEKYDKLKAEQKIDNDKAKTIIIELENNIKVNGKAFITTPGDILREYNYPDVYLAEIIYTDGHKVDTIKNIEVIGDENENDACDMKHLWDLFRPIEGSCKISFLTYDNTNVQAVFSHSSAHLLGLCVEQLYGAKVTIGPALESGFYYDFYIGKDRVITQKDFECIEKVAQSFTKKDIKYERLEISKEDALNLFIDNPFKLALINAKVEGKTTVYRCGPFIDLCTGPHIPSLKLIKAMKIMRNSGSYWLGDAGGDVLQRVYGIAFPNKTLLNNYLKKLEDAKKADHRVLGNDLKYFFFEPLYSPGCAFWTPHGSIIYNRLINFLRTEYKHRGYSEVVTPNIFTANLFKVSGHWHNYKENMYFFNIENKEWALKPMNCPSHCCIFKNLKLSYKQLPLRLADFGVLHRDELTGSLNGLTRVRRFQQDDAHIFCEIHQIESEVNNILNFLFFVYDIIGFRYEISLSTKPAKALGDASLWNEAENQLKSVLNNSQIKWKLNKGDGAFYGPKIDIEVYDALDRKHQCGTVQLDFQLPLRYNLQYQGPYNEKKTEKEDAATDELVTADIDSIETQKHVDGSLEEPLKPGMLRPIIIHRAIFGSIERFIAVLIEHYKGDLPFWLSPRQILICNITKDQENYSSYIYKLLKERDYAVECDFSTTTLNKKIVNARKYKWNYIAIIGAQEEETRMITLRSRESGKDQLKFNIPDCIAYFKNLADIAHRYTDEIPEYNKEQIY